MAGKFDHLEPTPEEIGTPPPGIEVGIVKVAHRRRKMVVELQRIQTSTPSSIAEVVQNQKALAVVLEFLLSRL